MFLQHSKNVQIRSASQILISLLVSFFVFGCADDGEFGGQQGQDKFGSTYEDEYGYYDESDESWNTDVESPWAETESETEGKVDSWSSEEEYQDTSTFHHSGSSSVNSGDSCGSGCIWSSYAVSVGAQHGEVQCGGGYCACVVNGDVWTLCDADAGSASSSQNDSGSPSSSSSSSSSSSNYDPVVGGRIADEAYYQASRRGTVGYCYSAAADAIEAVVGTFLYGASAYMAADQLAAHPRFTEVWGQHLPSLPAGAVVVWGRGSSPHGHISIALGNGQEASDHIAPQMTYHYGGAAARVFFPR